MAPFLLLAVVPRLPLARGTGLTPCFLRNLAISLTQVSFKSQAKPDPRAEQTGTTMPCAQTGLSVPQEHCLYGWGFLTILPDLKSRSLGNPGVGLAVRISENMTSPKRLTPFPSRLDNTLGRCEPGMSQEGEGSRVAQ